jgi:tRNA-binding protein
MENASFEEFQKIDIRIGTIVQAEPFPDANKSSYKLKIDFGSLGIKTSGAQITALYSLDNLKDKRILAVVNLGPMRIAGFTSEVLVLGVANDEKEIVLLEPESELPNGSVVR